MYHKKLENGHCTFRTSLDGCDIIISFSKSYLHKCHEACNGLGTVPELIRCEGLAGGWFAVVMECLHDHEMLQMCERKDNLWKAVKDAMGKMHDVGFCVWRPMATKHHGGAAQFD